MSVLFTNIGIAYGLSIGTKLGYLEWPWTAQWSVIKRYLIQYCSFRSHPMCQLHWSLSLSTTKTEPCRKSIAFGSLWRRTAFKRCHCQPYFIYFCMLYVGLETHTVLHERDWYRGCLGAVSGLMKSAFTIRRK